MFSAIEAVCNVAQRIIDKLKDGAVAGGPPLIGAAVGSSSAAYPPTPAMKRFADSLARQKGIKPPPGYKTSIPICQKFLNEHAPKKAEGETSEKLDAKAVSPAQMLYAARIAQGKGVVIPEEAKASSAAMSAWIESNRVTKRRKRGRTSAYKLAGSVTPQSTATTKRSRKGKADVDSAPPVPSAPAPPNSATTDTPLRIPYGNKEIALKLGARYRTGGWYAPPGADLSTFEARGWL
jgi:DNA topoisomerase III